MPDDEAWATRRHAGALLLRVWAEGGAADPQLKARLVGVSRVPANHPVPLPEPEYAQGVDGIVARVRAWLVAFDRDSRPPPEP